MQKRELPVDWRKLGIDVEIFPRNAIASKPIASSVMDYLVTSGLPSWCAPHLYFGPTAGVYLPPLAEWQWAVDWNESAYSVAVAKFPDSYVLGAAQDDEPIVLLPGDSAIYKLSDTGSSLEILNTSPEKLSRTVYAFAEVVEEAVSVNSAAFIESCVPHTLVEEFIAKFKRLEPSLWQQNSIWQEWASQTCDNA